MMLTSEKPNSGIENYNVTLLNSTKFVYHSKNRLLHNCAWAVHLNAIFVRGRVNLNEPTIKSSNTRGWDVEASN